MVRLKHRYILFEIRECDDRPEQKDLLDRIRQSLLFNFGTAATGHLNASLYLKYYSPRTGRGILQADRAHYRLAWAALTFLDLLDRGGGFVCALGVSGTIRKAEERLIGLDRRQMFLLA
ncbi:protein of unknown function [Taphrina deformans PYCC 5710]|uniref:Ribonuclease P/MRP protein subunit POP5 n=1 Tax=Taphrina deformans (strain PYCC 5710 / ATCC 11124 / CBS 356.35 / IMI 108563 / JCM 9778 / NBRC 8474) TaxID=1097556 RepID=R4XGB2_TAPDE|nr:protein of unknown function [Taphrina deformans PYCC 5710]|eukprot:CCG84667.1 protein of unknown function [Taphrina deformans PYCC 5710]